MHKLRMGRRALVATSALVLVSLGAGVSFAEGWINWGSLGSKTPGKQADGSYLMQTNQFVTPVDPQDRLGWRDVRGRQPAGRYLLG
jgi:hypothetical protein